MRKRPNFFIIRAGEWLTKEIDWLFLGVALILATSISRPTGSFFYDEAKLTGLSFSAASDFGETEKVVINEVMWMGSRGDEQDQWVELKNVSDREVHLQGWFLTDAEGNEILKIKDNRVIKAGGYFLAAYHKKNDSALNVNPDSDDLDDFETEEFQLRLYDAAGRLVDMAGHGQSGPEAGDGENFWSMERLEEYSDGQDYANWQTCFPGDIIRAYWDADREECGTPGGDNSFFAREAGQFEEVEKPENQE